MSRLLSLAVKKLSADEAGASMLEYCMMIALVAAACVVAVTALGTAVGGSINSTTASF
jgi:Flp pilus assembly pilin Flp